MFKVYVYLSILKNIIRVTVCRIQQTHKVSILMDRKFIPKTKKCKCGVIRTVYLHDMSYYNVSFVNGAETDIFF